MVAMSNYSTFSARSFGDTIDEEELWPTSKKKASFPLLVPLLLGVGIVFSVVITVQSYVSQQGVAPIIPLSEANALVAASSSSMSAIASVTGVRTLLLMRHAHASLLDNGASSDDDAADKARVLTSGGIIEANRIGKYFGDKQIFPDLIIASDSIRTKDTLTNLLDGINGAQGWNRDNVTIRYNSDIYTATNAKALLTIVKSVECQYRRVLLIGHNPSIGELATAVMGQATEPQDMLSMVMGGFTPAAVAVYAFRCNDATAASWDSSCVGMGKGVLTRFIDPAALAPASHNRPSNPFFKPDHIRHIKPMNGNDGSSSDDSGVPSIDIGASSVAPPAATASSYDSDPVPSDPDANLDDGTSEQSPETLRVVPAGIHYNSVGHASVDDNHLESDDDISLSNENWSSSQDDDGTPPPITETSSSSSSDSTTPTAPSSASYDDSSVATKTSETSATTPYGDHSAVTPAAAAAPVTSPVDKHHATASSSNGATSSIASYDDSSVSSSAAETSATTPYDDHHVSTSSSTTSAAAAAAATPTTTTSSNGVTSSSDNSNSEGDVLASLPESVKKWLREHDTNHDKKNKKTKKGSSPIHRLGSDTSDSSSVALPSSVGGAVVASDPTSGSSNNDNNDSVFGDLPSNIRQLIRDRSPHHKKKITNDSGNDAASSSSNTNVAPHHIVPIGGHHPSDRSVNTPHGPHHQPRIIRPKSSSGHH